MLNPAIQCANSSSIRPPAGHYSHVCIAGGFVIISGQLPINSAGQALADQSFEEQTRQVLSNLEHCLVRAGIDKYSLVQVRVYVTDIDQWPAFNRLYEQWLGDHRPARSVAGVAQLHFGSAVEVEAMALAATA
ncbi:MULTISPECIES: RidA family protein [Pseudomonas]|uniref:RidA family protein n=1 Tax=Pseudomonas gingeri TaxID=117681 RepID=A0A7Y7WE48_9PSED|nr:MULTISPECIES: RidA family protein [Pseudomonas]MPQ66617.1 RidA family protein [Pseudomonas sp. MWU12-2323]NWB47740.1 RidA family protein [Pseudomonas gingeri]